MALHPQTKALLEQAAASNTPQLDDGTPEEGRTVFATTTSMLGIPPRPVKEVKEIQIPGPNGPIRTVVITPNQTGSGPLPILIYFHGGGWVIGSPETHKGETHYFADAAQCIVLVPDYRKGPEHRFPAAPQDCYAVLEWAAANAASLGADSSRIAVAGDSAGGNLSAVVAQMTRDRNGPPLALQLLVYPATQMGSDTQSFKDFAEGYFLTARAMHWFYNHYVATKAEWDDPLASPLLADNLQGLAPAFIMTAGFDPLRDEGAAYADKLKAAGVPVEYVCYDEQIHGFVSLAGALDDGQAFLQRASAVLRKAFGA